MGEDRHNADFDRVQVNVSFEFPCDRPVGEIVAELEREIARHLFTYSAEVMSTVVFKAHIDGGAVG